MSESITTIIAVILVAAVIAVIMIGPLVVAGIALWHEKYLVAVLAMMVQFMFWNNA